MKKLGNHERLLLAKAIERGPNAAGYNGNIWTGKIVTDYIQKRGGVKYHPAHVRKLLSQLGFSVQFPREKLALADKEAQEKWLNETNPGIKKRQNDWSQNESITLPELNSPTFNMSHSVYNATSSRTDPHGITLNQEPQ